LNMIDTGKAKTGRLLDLLRNQNDRQTNNTRI
jgi:hypothetical protein